MAMGSFLAKLTSSTVLLLLLLLLLSHISCLNHNNQLPNKSQGLMVEEKTRLGSTPPSCYNKCNNCHPCMAVQVPPMPTHHQLRPAAASRFTRGPITSRTATPAASMDNYFDSSSPYPSAGNRYSNYKPLGWKCRCDGHFYNP